MTARAARERVWVPTRAVVGATGIPVSVARWVWRRSHGLRVVYRDGSVYPSVYGGLRAFLHAVRLGREWAIELPPADPENGGL